MLRGGQGANDPRARVRKIASQSLPVHQLEPKVTVMAAKKKPAKKKKMEKKK